MWLGPQADVGRYLSNQGLNVAYWQPIGYWNNQFPLGKGRDAGLAELRTQIDRHPGPFLISAWSLGAIVAADWYKEAKSGGIQANRLHDLRGVTTFGNPYREAGHWAPKALMGDPGGEGIGGGRNNLSNTPDWWHDYAHAGDLYTCCPVGPIGDDCRIVFDLVLSKYDGFVWDLWAEALEVVSEPLQAAPAVLMAIVKAITFYGGGTADHVNYDARALGALNYMAGIARSIR